MKVLNAVACGDDFTNVATITAVWPSSGGAFDVVNQPVLVEMQFGAAQFADWTPAFPKGVGSGYTIPANCSGIRFRNQTAGKVATVTCVLAGGSEGAVTGGFPAAAAATLITGRVGAAGNVISGSGFTVTKGAVGVYTLNWTTPFQNNPPSVVCMEVNRVAASDVVIYSNTETTAQCPLTVRSTTAGNQDRDFDFIAQAMV